MLGKYSNVLTMLLVIFIVAILGIVGYFTYDILHSNSVNANAREAINEFEGSKKEIKKDTSNLNKDNKNEVSDNEISSPLDKLKQDDEQQQPANTDDIEKIYMEDYEIMGTIKIPKTGIEYPVLDKVTKRSIELSVAIAYGPGFNGVGNLNEVGNTIIYGHNYRNGLFFSDNKKLSEGDEIYITDKFGTTVTYSIYKIYQTDGNDASYFTRDTEGKREISLQTCTDYNNNTRIIIWAKEKE